MEKVKNKEEIAKILEELLIVFGKRKLDEKNPKQYSKDIAEITKRLEKIAEFQKVQLKEELGNDYENIDFSLYSKFDFAIFNSDGTLLKLIEFDGEQHFNAVELFGGEEQLKIQQERDKNKNEYCKKHNIPLLRIPYYDFDKMDIDYLLNNITVF